MTSKFLRISLAVAVLFVVSALAQTGSAATSPASTSPASAAPATAAAPITGTKVGCINVEGAIFGSNEGRRDMETLGKKYEPKNNELKSQNDELESMKKELTTQEAKLNDEALAARKKAIESKQKLFDRAVQDAQEEFGTQQQEVANRILQKMAPVIVSYARDNGYGMIIDTSKPWPQGPVMIAGDGVDLTKAVVDIYNTQSGVPAPAPAGAGAKPATRPSAGAGAAKPAAPKTAEPPK